MLKRELRIHWTEKETWLFYLFYYALATLYPESQSFSLWRQRSSANKPRGCTVPSVLVESHRPKSVNTSHSRAYSRGKARSPIKCHGWAMIVAWLSCPVGKVDAATRQTIFLIGLFLNISVCRALFSGLRTIRSICLHVSDLIKHR